VLPRASLSRAESSWLAKASGRSPDLVSQMRVKVDCVSCRRQPSRSGISGLVADSFESITVAGPRGNLTRFPILPDSRGTRSSIEI
jgi:hypothetical protein